MQSAAGESRLGIPFFSQSLFGCHCCGAFADQRVPENRDCGFRLDRTWGDGRGRDWNSGRRCFSNRVCGRPGALPYDALLVALDPLSLAWASTRSRAGLVGLKFLSFLVSRYLGLAGLSRGPRCRPAPSPFHSDATTEYRRLNCDWNHSKRELPVGRKSPDRKSVV